MFLPVFFFVILFELICRHSLFARNSVKTIEADLSRLYTATSLMQIDDNVMRFAPDSPSLALTFTSEKAKSFEVSPFCFLLSSGRKFHGHNSLKEYYEKESCVHYIHNVSTCSQRWTQRLVLLPATSACVSVQCTSFGFPGEGATPAGERCRWPSGSWLAARHPSHTSR